MPCSNNLTSKIVISAILATPPSIASFAEILAFGFADTSGIYEVLLELSAQPATGPPMSIVLNNF